MNNELVQQEKYIREHWFPNHVANFDEVMMTERSVSSERPLIQTLNWRKPESSTYFCGYLIRRGMLFVYGDIGEAVYGWSQDLTWEWLAGLDLDYFAGKCFASETGRGFRGWDPRKAKARLDELLFGNDNLIKKFRRVEEPCTGLRHDWHHWLSQYGSDVFGDSNISLGEISNIGDCVHIRCHGHLLGIRMAVEQMNRAAK